MANPDITLAIAEDAMKKITLEEHFGTPEVAAIRKDWSARTGFPQLRLPASVIDKLADVEQFRLPEMDAHGIAMQVLSISESSVQKMENAAAAVALAGKFNDTLAEIVRRHPDRFAAFATLPLQDPEAAAHELERAVTQLRFKGALIHGHTNGAYLDQQPFWVVWERAQALDVPIYLHPTDPIPDQVKIYQGRPELLGPTWNWGVETATHALRIVFGGVFDAFPRATLILGHMGEMLPFFLTRIDRRWELSGDTRSIKKRPSDYLKENVFITTTGVLSHQALLCAVLSLGVERVLFSVDYPFESTAEAVGFIDSAPLADGDREKVCHLNAERLLRL